MQLLLSRLDHTYTYICLHFGLDGGRLTTTTLPCHVMLIETFAFVAVTSAGPGSREVRCFASKFQGFMLTFQLV